MKKTALLILLVIFISCSPKFDKKFSVAKNSHNYKMWISYYGMKKDTIVINWLMSYQIENNTNRGVQFMSFGKRPEYSRQYAEEKSNDSLILFNWLIFKKSYRELLINCSKKVHVKKIPNYIIDNPKAMFSLGEFKKNITKIPPEQIKFRESPYFQSILKEIENDSIAIVFRDSVADDYFEFKGIIKDDKLQFSR